jgi:hypothetical protein
MAAPPAVPRHPSLKARVLTLSALGLVLLGLTLGTNMFSPLVRGWRQSAGIVERSREYRQQVRDNEALEAEIGFLKSDKGRQWAAWRHHSLVQPGQQVGRTIETSPPPVAPLSRAESVRNWLVEQETRSSQNLRSAGEVLNCYLGRRPLDGPVPKRKHKRPVAASKPQPAH